MSHEDYAALPGLNWSTLRYLATSPRFLAFRVHTPPEDKDAFRVGRALHCAVLEPERFAQEYFEQPDFGDMRFKENKGRRGDWLHGLPGGAQILKREEFGMVVRAAESLHAHRKAQQIFSGGRAEETCTWTDEATGIACKGRFDYITPSYIADLKGTRRETLRGIVRDFEAFLYYGQLAYYHDGAIAAGKLPPSALRPCGAFVQTVEPYDVVPFRMTERSLDVGRALYQMLLRRYNECQAASYWPGLASDIVEIDVSAYAETGTAASEEW